MSYILDALRKSQQERQVWRAPDLETQYHLKTPPERERPMWAIVALVLAVIAVGLAAAAYFGRTVPEPSVAATDPIPAALPLPTEVPSRAAAAAPSAEATAGSSAEERTRPAVAAKAAAPTGAAVESGGDGRAEPAVAARTVPPTVRPTPSPPATPSTESDTGSNPWSADAASGVVPTWADLPSELRRGASAPELSVHVYADRPEARYVFLNGSRYREGAVLQEGTRVEAISPTGLVLSRDGIRFRIDL